MNRSESLEFGWWNFPVMVTILSLFFIMIPLCIGAPKNSPLPALAAVPLAFTLLLGIINHAIGGAFYNSNLFTWFKRRER